MKRIGILGTSEGNGHPFSFSAIVNGYSDEALARSGWPVIHGYVRRRHPSELGFDGFRITHAWTQDPEETSRLCEACLVPERVRRAEDLIDHVDAVIIARDDHENHWTMARPFLEAGLPVFVDKPLCLDAEELSLFAPYLASGKLMSCSGMRYAVELDAVRAGLPEYGELKLVRAVAPNAWDKYGIHVLEGVLSVVPARPVDVSPHQAGHRSAAITLSNGCSFLVDALGSAPASFQIDFYGTSSSSRHEVRDNFSMFRRMLWEFFRMIETGEPPIAPERTLDLMRALMAGSRAFAERRRVRLDELPI